MSDPQGGFINISGDVYQTNNFYTNTILYLIHVSVKLNALCLSFVLFFMVTLLACKLFFDFVNLTKLLLVSFVFFLLALV